MTTVGLRAIITERSRNARVVELADSLDSGSSAHSGRAGSSPASRTMIPDFVRDRGFFLSGVSEKANPNHRFKTTEKDCKTAKNPIQ